MAGEDEVKLRGCDEEVDLRAKRREDGRKCEWIYAVFIGLIARGKARTGTVAIRIMGTRRPSPHPINLLSIYRDSFLFYPDLNRFIQAAHCHNR